MRLNRIDPPARGALRLAFVLVAVAAGCGARTASLEPLPLLHRDSGAVEDDASSDDTTDDGPIEDASAIDAPAVRDANMVRDVFVADAQPVSDGGPRGCKKAPPGVTSLGKVSGDTSFVAVDDTGLYWTDQVAGTVNAVPLAGGLTTVLAMGQAGVDRLALDALYVYFTTNDSVLRVPKDGSAPPLTLAANQTPVGIAVDATRVYWTNYRGDGAIMMCSPAACMPQVFAANQPDPDTIVVDAVNAYWTNHDTSNPAVVQMPLHGGTAISLVTGGSHYPLGIVADSTNLYFSDNFTPGSVYRVPIGGGSPAVALQSQNGDPRFMAVDDTRVYWADPSAGTITAVAKGGGTPVTIASGQDGALSVAVDACNVYWATRAVVAMTPK
jgi:hypothetical protein